MNESTCCTCGYTWPTGQHGGHSCTDQLLARVAELEAGNLYKQRTIDGMNDAHAAVVQELAALKQPSAGVDERKQMIEEMCMTWRHDFGLDKPENAFAFGSCGMTDDEREGLRRQMGQLFDHHFSPALQSRAQLAAPAWVPDGWRLVPVEPTEDMLRAGLQYDSEQDPNNPDSRVEELKIDYGLMISAAPSPASAYRSYTTTPGEAVAGIALRQLKDESRWVEIRDLNAHAFPDIGPNDYYPVGTVLRLPAPASARPELTVWCGPMPESNGKSNFTAILMRKGADCFDGIAGGITIERSEYPDRVRYEADRMRYLIGELESEPDILAYDPDKHSGYKVPASDVVPVRRKELVEIKLMFEFVEGRPWLRADAAESAYEQINALLNGGRV